MKKTYVWILIVILLGSILHPVQAGTQSDTQKSEELPSAKTVLEAPNKNDEECENGFRLHKHVTGNLGPDSFAVITENDILVLESWMGYVKRFQNGRYVATIELDADDLYDGGLLATNDRYAYVAGKEGLIRIDLSNYSLTRYLYTVEGIGEYITDLVFEEDHLVLISEQMGNYCFDPADGSLTKTNLGTHRETLESNGQCVLHVVREDNEWFLNNSGAIDVVGVDKEGNLYIRVFDFSLNTADPEIYTIRKYDPNGNLTAYISIDITNQFEFPYHDVRLGNDGRIYMMTVYEPYTAVYSFDNSLKESLPEPHISQAPEKPVPQETKKGKTNETKGPWDYEIQPMPVTRTRTQVLESAKKMRDQKWTFRSWSGKNWKYAYDSGLGRTIYSRPAYLANAKTGDVFTGIPYCWNGMNGNQGETLYPFIDCVGQKKNTTGNCTTTIIGDTIGIDCSGFVSAAYGLDNKVNTSSYYDDPLADTYYPEINFSDLQPMDMVVKNGHMMLFLKWETNGSSFKTIESKASNSKLDSEGKVKYNSNDGKVVTRTVTASSLGDDYIYRRPKHWFTSCQHSGTYQQSTAAEHNIVCSKCGQLIRVEAHQFSVTSSTDTKHTRHCSLCDYTRTDNHTFKYSDITTTTHTKTCSVCGKQIRERHTFASGTGNCTQCGAASPYSPDWVDLPVGE